jgi:hypothetical protein
MHAPAWLTEEQALFLVAKSETPEALAERQGVQGGSVPAGPAAGERPAPCGQGPAVGAGLGPPNPLALAPQGRWPGGGSKGVKDVSRRSSLR